MKLTKSLIIPSVVFMLSIFAAAYTITTQYEPLIQVFAPSLLDSLDSLGMTETAMMEGEGKDVSQMFNERGYYKSSSFSFDENEIINDFNGNLMYEIPLYNFKHAGEMQYEVKMIYNGSVGHQVNLGNVGIWDNQLNQTLRRHNMNAPEWILSLNGMAVQVFNFETNFFSNQLTNSNYVEGDNLHMLIPGYHFCNIMKNISWEKDRINLLSGDGSLITLVNKSTNSGASFTGVYHSEGKETHYWAEVQFDPQDSSPESMRNRIIEFTRGDGMVFVYKEIKRKFADFGLTESTGNFRPRMPLLTEIRDRFGYKLELFYEFTHAPGTVGVELVGRPLLVGINPNIQNLSNGSLSIAYAVNAFKIFNASSVNGNFRFGMNPAVYYTSGSNNGIANHKGYITSITNPNLQTANITYEGNANYRRLFTGVPNPLFSPEVLNLKFSTIQRMKSFTNFLGGIREYSYYPASVNELTISYYSPSYNRTTYYKGYGREPFYSNMLTNRTDKFNTTSPKSETGFEYSYSDGGTHNDQNFPVDDADTYTAERTTSSQSSGTLNESPQSTKVIREYKVFPVRLGSPNDYPLDVQNYNGVTKLIKEEYFDTDNNNQLYQKNEFAYQTEPKSGYAFDGSFLMTTRKNIIKNTERRWDYDYDYKDATGGGNEYDSLVIWKREIDPKYNRGETYFYNFDTLLNFNIPSAGYNGATEEHKRRFYKIGFPTEEIRKSAGNVLLFKKKNEYLFSVNDSRGYYGQLVSEKTYEAPNFSNSIEVKYEYYKQDNEGSSNYTSGAVPYQEGNLKRVIKPNNEEEKYFYHPVSNYENELYTGISESGQTPKISYRVKYNNGSTSIQINYWEDNRLPIRIDNYRRISSNSVDTLKRIYMEYNEAGMPVKIINENRYLTELKYQATHRISAITLPGDFSTIASYDSLYVDENISPQTLIIPANGWGHVDYENNLNKAVVKDETFWYAYPDACDRFTMQFQTNGNNWAAFFKFNVLLRNFSQIDSATYSMWHLVYNRSVNGNPPPTSDYSTILQPVDSLYAYGLDDECGNNNYRTRGVRVNSNTQTIVVSPDSYNGCYPVYDSYDIKNLLLNMKQGNRDVYGIMVKPTFRFRESEEGEGSVIDAGSSINFYMNFFNYTCTNLYTTTFMNNYNEKIAISGQYVDRDTIVIPVVHGGTYVYRYDDVNNIVLTYSRLSHSPNVLKKIKYHVDGLGNIKEKDIYTTANDYNTYLYKFNYLNKLAEDVDGRDLSTKYSYDMLERSSETKFTDDSKTASNYDYTDELPGYFGNTYQYFVERQTFTDETNRKFDKYFDAVGNLLREIKYINEEEVIDPDSPYDPDTTISGIDSPGETALVTDYKYDDLYRLIEVKTPNNKSITYYYDGYGRQRARNTPDAGITNYKYDNNNNLYFSQDASQYARGTNVYTFRNYDAINRLTSIGEMQPGGGGVGFEDIDIENPPSTDNPAGDGMFTINVYDTLTTASVNIFTSSKPNDYYSAPNYTKGHLVATAYRTKLTDSWGYKFYRYDERGNVMKMWSFIDGLGWKEMTYQYNSQGQNTYFDYQPNSADGKMFKYSFDQAGRLSASDLYQGAWTPNPEEEDAPGSFYGLTSYTYNQNSQVLTHKVNNNQLTTTYTYNNRNWVNWTTQSPGTIFRYVLFYNANGNIRYQDLQGSYSNNFGVTGTRRNVFIYDKSNRLVKANEILAADSNTYDIINTYDKDGNFLTLKRYGSSNNLVDNFSYSYYSGTNKLKNIGGVQDYTYDNNGNVTLDDLNKNTGLKYDYRNLLIENTNVLTQFSYRTYYRYDEAGNRINKRQYIYILGTPPGGGIEEGEGGPPQYGDSILVDEGDGSGYWSLTSNTFYVRDISGKEIAIYNSSNLVQWNLWGLDQVGHMNADTTKYYYLKDHLGSTRAVVNSRNSVRSAEDYDCWGYIMENRSYQPENNRYKFTGKERDRDIESNYDYFGARYYDSRVGRWGGVEPLMDKYVDVTPYCYSLCNPVIAKDVNGKDAKITINNDTKTITFEMNFAYMSSEFNSNYGLNESQIGALETFEADIEDYWTGIEVELNGTKYTVETQVNLIETKSLNELNSVGNADGNNFALNQTINAEIGVNEEYSGVGIIGNTLYISKSSELRTDKYTGPHEAGHLMGLPDRGYWGTSIMHWSKNRNQMMSRPDAADVKEIFKSNSNVNINSSQTQTMRSVQ
ncbi:MAG: hypothetical protein K8I03_01050 [Ignavibacteria bacterium]|nr:hypothetical protein [Ignavibacteria bacterium]